MARCRCHGSCYELFPVALLARWAKQEDLSELTASYWTRVGELSFEIDWWDWLTWRNLFPLGKQLAHESLINEE